MLTSSPSLQSLPKCSQKSFWKEYSELIENYHLCASLSNIIWFQNHPPPPNCSIIAIWEASKPVDGSCFWYFFCVTLGRSSDSWGSWISEKERGTSRTCVIKLPWRLKWGHGCEAQCLAQKVPYKYQSQHSSSSLKSEPFPLSKESLGTGIAVNELRERYVSISDSPHPNCSSV